MSIFHAHEKNQKENQAVVINTWSSKELALMQGLARPMHGIASFFFYLICASLCFSDFYSESFLPG